LVGLKLTSCRRRFAQLIFHDFGLFVWLVADGWCWFVLREKYCWLVAGGWFVLREKYCWLVADKPSEQAASKDNLRFCEEKWDTSPSKKGIRDLGI
jgi:hypothetical protein